MDNPYAVLSIKFGASTEEIRSAYRHLSSQFHPDRNHGADAALKFRNIRAAYEILSDPDRKKALDAKISEMVVNDPLAEMVNLVNNYLNEVAHGN